MYIWFGRVLEIKIDEKLFFANYASRSDGYKFCFPHKCVLLILTSFWCSIYSLSASTKIDSRIPKLLVKILMDSLMDGTRAKTKNQMLKNLKTCHRRWTLQFNSNPFHAIENCDHERSSGIFRLEFLSSHECCEWIDDVEKLLDVRRCNKDSTDKSLDI